MLQVFPDAMHTLKDVVEKIIKLVTADETAIKKVVKTEVILKRLSGDHAAVGKLPFCVSHEQVQLADERAQSIIIPANLNYMPITPFTHSKALKSHDWKEVCVLCT